MLARAHVPPHVWRSALAVIAAFAGAGAIGWGLAGVAGLAAALAAGSIAVAFDAALALGDRQLRPDPTLASPVGEALGEITAEVGIGFALVGKDGRLRYANHVFQSLLALPAEAVGTPVVDHLAADDHAQVEQTIERLIAREISLRELRVRPARGSCEAMLITMGYTERYDRLFISCKDDSYQLKLEAQVRQATKMQAVGQLAGGVAHDFNNILTAIIGTCDLMLMRHGPGSVDHQDITQIGQNANRAANLTRQLLAFSRQQTLKTRVVQLPDVLGELSHLLRRLLGENVRLRVQHARDLAAVRADPGQLEQVIVNLAVNARDAMPGGGDLTIATYGVGAGEVAALGHRMMPPADYVAIAVRDTGEGIPTAIIGQIFDPFFTTKELGKGTGLGLSMVYGIVKQSGGFIFADSAPGLGTTFNIYLPAVTDVPTEVASAPVAVADWGQGRILIVEDEAMVRAVAARALTRSGYEVLTAGDGEEALALLADEGVIDLMISDVVMPGMDGPTLVQRAREARPDLRVLFISGYAEEQLRGRVDDPAATLLRKPFSVHELAEAVRMRIAA